MPALYNRKVVFYMAKKKMVLVVDVEGTSHGYVYDVGFAVTDLYGNVYDTFSGMVSEVVIGMPVEMATAYYVKKMPVYVHRLNRGDTICIGLNTIREKVFEVMKQYDIDTVCAYNIMYDRRALNRTITTISNGFVDTFFPEGTIFWDIWGMACETILRTKRYATQAIENGWVSEKGNIKSSAEYAYRYISGEDTFEEEHTGLADVLIETAILAATIKTHKKMTRTEIPCPWRLIQK